MSVKAVIPPPEAVPDELLQILRAPRDLAPLVVSEHSLKTDDGRSFDFEQGILRTLGQVDPLLEAELRAQAMAVDEYSDPRLLMPRYERDFVVRMMIEDFLGSTVDSGQRVLDAGCGIGLLGRLYPNLGLVGLDASKVLLDRAETGYRLRVEGSAEHMPFADASFDVVVALNMLHHVIEPKNAVREFARVLAPGGVLVTVDPRKVWPIELAKKVLRSNDDAFAETHKAFAVAEYEELLSMGGLFQIERYERKGLAGLVGMAGLDATRLSHRLPSADLAVNWLIRIDNTLHSLPFVERACLNLAVRARRTDLDAT